MRGCDKAEESYQAAPGAIQHEIALADKSHELEDLMVVYEKVNGTLVVDPKVNIISVSVNKFKLESYHRNIRINFTKFGEIVVILKTLSGL